MRSQDILSSKTQPGLLYFLVNGFPAFNIGTIQVVRGYGSIHRCSSLISQNCVVPGGYYIDKFMKVVSSFVLQMPAISAFD